MSSFVDKNVGERIRKLRESENISVDHLSALTGITTELLIAFEKGDARIGAERLLAIAKGLRVDWRYLFDIDTIDDKRTVTNSFHEKRKYPRFPCNLDAQIQVDETCAPCRLVSISFGGARTSYAGILEKEKRIQILWNQVGYPATVKWSSIHFGHGLQFVWRAPVSLIEDQAAIASRGPRRLGAVH